MGYKSRGCFNVNTNICEKCKKLIDYCECKSDKQEVIYGDNMG